jgi:glycine cleavage system H protein
MSKDKPQRAPTIPYKRAQFKSRLPTDRLYTRSHYWLRQDDDGIWQVGMTKFATRMLGELVEFDFEVKPNTAIEVGQIIGWIEGFKATADLYSSISGEFIGRNAQLESNPNLQADTYGKGWLFSADGEPDANVIDVHGYVEHLNYAIDLILDGEL